MADTEPDPLIHLLSRQGREIAEGFGLSAALKIAERWGGLYLCVPKTVGPTHELFALLGSDAARFCRHYGGERLWPAKEEAYFQAVRVGEMRALKLAETPLVDIARRYGLTVRQVVRLLGPSDGYRQETLPGFD